MKPEDISDAIGMLDDKLIAAAENTRKRQSTKRCISKKYISKRYLIPCTAAVLAFFCFAAPFVFHHFGTTEPSVMPIYAISKAVYPKMTPYPNPEDNLNSSSYEQEAAYDRQYKQWQKEQDEQMNHADLAKEHIENLNGFFSETMKQLLSTRTAPHPLTGFLSHSDDKNYVCSPFNIYMALSILSELCDGNSQQQILDLLGINTINDLQSQANCLWNAEYCNDGITTNILGNSLWLNESIPFRQSLLNTVAEKYYASSYQGTMGSKEFNQMLQNWINEQTNDLLTSKTKNMNLAKKTVLSLVSTIYFQSVFSEEFLEYDTEEAVFHSTYRDITCQFMHQDNSQDYYEGKNFLAVKKYLEGRQTLWLFLPDKETNVCELLNDNTIMNLLLYESEIATDIETADKSVLPELADIKRKTALIHLALPKFDISSEFDLNEPLQAMGITDIFNEAKADFSPLIEEPSSDVFLYDQENIYLSKVNHTVRLLLDEEGILAAAYTKMDLYSYTNATGKLDEIDIAFDRPFLFIISGKAKTPLFAGIVNNPNKTS